MDNKSNVKSAIEELRKVVMSLYRSAGNLDTVLESIELELDDTKTTDLYTEFFCRSKQIYRSDVKKAAGFSGLDEAEAEAWKKLLEALHNEETES